MILKLEVSIHCKFARKNKKHQYIASPNICQGPKSAFNSDWPRISLRVEKAKLKMHNCGIPLLGPFAVAHGGQAQNRAFVKREAYLDGRTGRATRDERRRIFLTEGGEWVILRLARRGGVRVWPDN